MLFLWPECARGRRAVPAERRAWQGRAGRASRTGGASTISPSVARARSTSRTWHLRAALAGELDRRAVELPVLCGNRNWHPYTADTLRDAHAFGARRILVLITSAYAS